MRRRFTPRRSANRYRQGGDHSPRLSRSDILTAAKKFSSTINSSHDGIVTATQLAEYFARCDAFYCRPGNPESAAASALRTIHGHDADAQKSTDVEADSCSLADLEK